MLDAHQLTGVPSLVSTRLVAAGPVAALLLLPASTFSRWPFNFCWVTMLLLLRQKMIEQLYFRSSEQAPKMP